MKTFKEITIGDKFYFAGGIWIKKSSRTAWIANKTQFFYFGKNEEVTT